MKNGGRLEDEEGRKIGVGLWIGVEVSHTWWMDCELKWWLLSTY